jgi:cis-3-alkyl-4-acyloxetan-2-one decarboxylase
VSAPFPFAANYFQRNGHRLHYLDEGSSGDPVVMVHGNPTWSFYYRNLVLALRDTHRCIVPDHIGCGYSDQPQPPAYDYSLQSRLDDFTAFIDSLNLGDRVSLVVHDWGGMIGFHWATRNPDRVKKLVVLNTAAFHLPKSKGFPWRLWLGRNTSLGAWLIRSKNAFCRHAANIGVKRQPMSAETREWYLKPYGTWETRISVLKFVQTIPLKPTDEGYATIGEIDAGLAKLADKPMLICWGMKDFVFDRHFLAEWERRFPKADVHRFADCGHYILEDAAAEVIPLAKQFLST